MTYQKKYVKMLKRFYRRNKYGVEDKLLMLGTRKLNLNNDDNEYYCIEYTHFLLVRLLYDELKKKLGI